MKNLLVLFFSKLLLFSCSSFQDDFKFYKGRAYKIPIPQSWEVTRKHNIDLGFSDFNAQLEFIAFDSDKVKNNPKEVTL